MELIFFVVAQMVLCFEFVAEMVLITHQCFGCCWAVPAQCRGFLFLCSLGMQLWTGQRDTPSHKTFSNNTPSHPKPKEQTVWEAAFQGCCCLETGGTTGPVGGGSGWLCITYLFLLPSFIHPSFTYLTIFIPTYDFSHFILCLILRWGEGTSSCVSA